MINQEKSVWLIQHVRHFHHKFRNFWLEEFTVFGFHEFEKTAHASHARFEVTRTLVRKEFTRREYRLFANHAFSFNHCFYAVTIKNVPMSAEKLYFKVVEILNSDAVKKHEVPRVVKLVKLNSFSLLRIEFYQLQWQINDHFWNPLPKWVKKCW